MGITMSTFDYGMAKYVSDVLELYDKKDKDLVRRIMEAYQRGKRKINLLGTSSKKKQFKELNKLTQNVPPELDEIINKTFTTHFNIVEQVKSGNSKAINQLLGIVIKQYKIDGLVLKKIIESKINVYNS
jgi:Asp-tRNA(Asn)/Glu-tRNA(Gln) amidotransferase B subunit